MTNTVSQEDKGVFASPSIVRRHQTVLNLRLQQFVLLTTQTEASHIRWNQPPKHKTIFQVCVKGRGFPLDISYFSSLCSSPHGAQAVHHPCQQQETFFKWKLKCKRKNSNNQKVTQSCCLFVGFDLLRAEAEFLSRN